MTGAHKAQLAQWLPLIVLVLTGAITVGALVTRLAAAEGVIGQIYREVGDIKRSYVTEREFGVLNNRLGRIEGKIDNIDSYFRRPSP